MKNSWKVFNDNASYAAFAAGVAIGVILFFKERDRMAPAIFFYSCIGAASTYWLMGSAMIFWYAILEGVGILRAKFSADPAFDDVVKTAILMLIATAGATIGGPITAYFTSDEYNAKATIHRAAAEKEVVCQNTNI
ncbi:hypothetical protein M1432_00855 [Patescibacteria group bacterium]|nr:hypothetical protein [Patescibacteria group bacterium]